MYVQVYQGDSAKYVIQNVPVEWQRHRVHHTPSFSYTREAQWDAYRAKLHIFLDQKHRPIFHRVAIAAESKKDIKKFFNGFKKETKKSETFRQEADSLEDVLSIQIKK